MNLLLLVSFCSLLHLALFVQRNQCYSFDNHELNEQLRQSLEDYMYLAEDDTRGKREVEVDGSHPQGGDGPRPHGGHGGHHDEDDKFICKHRHFKSCCGDENIMKKFVDKDKSIGKACYKNVSSRMEELKLKSKQEHMGGDPVDLFSCEGLKNMKKKIYCVNECIGKKHQLLNEDGSLNAAKLREFLMSEDFNQEWQKDLVTQGMDECLKKDLYKSSISKEESTDMGDLNCNPTYLQFLSCLYKEIEMGCPDQYQKNSKKCKSMREHYANNKKRMLDLMKN